MARRYSQPQAGPAQIDAKFAAGLVCLVNPAWDMLDQVSRAPITLSAGGVKVRQDGKCRDNQSLIHLSTLTVPVSVPAGSDFTVMVRVNSLDTYPGNNGLFRSVTGSDTFCIIPVGVGRTPWVRLATVDVYNSAGSGAAVPTGRPVTIVFTVRSGNRVDVAWDGVVQHSGTFSTTTPAFTFTSLANQYAENIGDFSLFAFWNRAYDAASLSANPWQIFKPAQQLFKAATGGASNLSAAGSDTVAGSAAISAQVALAAVGVSTASGSAAPIVSIPLSAAGFDVAGGGANATATVTLSAAGLAQAAGQAGLSASVLLAAAGAAQAAGNATLAAQLGALAAGADQAFGTANLTGGAPGALAASGGDVASGTANAQAGVSVSAAGADQVSGTANLTGGAPGSLAASGGDVASGSTVLSVTVRLQATGGDVASGTANGQAGAPGAISATGGDTAGGSATWSTLVTVTAAGFVQAMGAGAFTVSVPLSAAGHDSAGGQAAATVSGLVRNFRLRAAAPVLVTRATSTADRLTTIHHGVSHG